MTLPSVDQAARNNAAWCDAVAAAHGHAGRWSATLWTQTAITLPLYPNVVTLTRDAAFDCPLAGVRSIKDSHAALAALASAGFEPLFDAQWLARPAPDPNAAGSEKIASAAALREWQDAWHRCEPAVALPAGGLFREGLLAHPGVAFLAWRRSGAIAAGAAVCLSDGVVGLSNVFGEAPVGAVESAAATCAPGRPLVGYESGPRALEAQHAGWQALGPLRVWIRSAGEAA